MSEERIGRPRGGKKRAAKVARAKENKKHPTFEYPLPAERRIGCKVRWFYYTSEEDAKKAADVARREAVHRSDQGYDFGYMCPGSIQPHLTGPYAGMWEVCLP